MPSTSVKKDNYFDLLDHFVQRLIYCFQSSTLEINRPLDKLSIRAIWAVVNRWMIEI